MGMTFENLTCEELCDLMCGIPDGEEEDDGEGNICQDYGQFGGDNKGL